MRRYRCLYIVDILAKFFKIQVSIVKFKKKMRSKKAKTVEPENWTCAVCSKIFPAGNELTFHYMAHSILELAVGKFNFLCLRFENH